MAATTTHHSILTSNNGGKALNTPSAANKAQVKRAVYNMYRDMLVSYNDKANDIVDSLPRRIVREDQGVTRQLESMVRQQTNTPSPSEQSSNYASSIESAPFAPPAPPPPPPPVGCPSQLPSKRLSTEIPDRRIEPPACVQNAMMTKDKKPFTYTPGGLDLSQIKSPRMARRINRNAHAEGVSDVPKQSPLVQSSGPLPPSALAAMQPQLPVAVFPTGVSPQQNVPPPPPPPPPIQETNPTVNVQVKQPSPVQNYQRPDIKIPANPTTLLRPTGGPVRRVYNTEPIEDQPQEIVKPQESTINKQTNKSQLGSLYIPPLESNDMKQQRQQQTPQKVIQSPQIVQSPVLNKAPTPWLTQRPQTQQNVPSWAHRSEEATECNNNKQSAPTNTARVVPLQIETQTRPQNRVQSNNQTNNTHIIPIQIETNRRPTTNGTTINNQTPPMNQFAKMQIQDDQNLLNKFRNQVDEDTFLHNETDPRYRGAAIPSRAFRILQTMTDTCSTSSSDTPLSHNVSGQRNSGPVIHNIPIQRAYDDDTVTNQQRYVPASEQQAPEPRKYTGSAIPSRSFRILQAMTAPNNDNKACGPDESDL